MSDLDKTVYRSSVKYDKRRDQWKASVDFFNGEYWDEFDSEFYGLKFFAHSNCRRAIKRHAKGLYGNKNNYDYYDKAGNKL
jgi:hypothetical protein